MRALILGAGGVGGAAAVIAARREFFDEVVMADYDGDRAKQVAERTGDARFSGVQVDATVQAQRRFRIMGKTPTKRSWSMTIAQHSLAP